MTMAANAIRTRMTIGMGVIEYALTSLMQYQTVSERSGTSSTGIVLCCINLYATEPNMNSPMPARLWVPCASSLSIRLQNQMVIPGC